MFDSDAQLLLSPGASAAWDGVVRPWLERGRGTLSRRLVVVPTRGQALVWKQRCVRVGLPLLGVEFITPGLARRKWLPASGEQRPVLGQEFLRFGLRGLIAERLAAQAGEEAMTGGVWRSLRSDPDRVLEALDDLLHAGFSPADFPRRELAELGVALREWTERLGYGFGAGQVIAAATEPLPAGTPALVDDLLVLGLGPENANEFFNVAALVRRSSRATVVLPAPGLRGAGDADPTERPDEDWVTRWERFLRVEPVMIESAAGPEGELGAPEPISLAAECLLGAAREDEAELIVRRLYRWLEEDAGGSVAGDIGVIFPGPGPLHRLVSARLRALGFPHHDLVGRSATAPVDTLILRGVIEFWARGGRLDEVLALWPRLKALNLAGMQATEAEFRGHVEARFHATCDHALAAAVAPIAASASDSSASLDDPDAEGDGAADLRRLAATLLPPWPARVTLAIAMARLMEVTRAWSVSPPEGFATLVAFSALDGREWPRELVAELALEFLPEVAVADEPAPQRGFFSPVVLTTRRRAEGAPWGRLILAQANAGDWPRRREANPWLDDAARLALNRSGRGRAALLTAEAAAALERAGHASLARDAGVALAVSAAARDEADPDRALAPNAFLERLLWARGERRPREALARLGLEAAGRGSDAPDAPAEWRAARAGRADPTRPFDRFFLCIEATDTNPAPLPARLSPSTLEKGVVDPAVLWFRGLLRMEPARREPLARMMPRRRGQTAHRLLAAAVRPEGCRDGEWGALRPEADARERLERGLAAERAARPADQWYWAAEHGRLEALCRGLLARFYACGEGEYAVVECWLPEAARLTLPGWDIPVRGRMDAARADRPGWDGARVRLFDYKSGGAEKALDAGRIGERAESLQLAIYLDAVRSLGVAEASICKLTPDEASVLGTDDLAEALRALPALLDAMRSGRYGALTPDRNPHGGPDPWVWPLACTPIPARDLRAKYALTFGAAPESNEETLDE
jgi:hypothetical protein